MTWMIGFIASAGLLFWTAEGSKLFLNLHSAALVIGGTLTLTLLMTPLRTLIELGSVFIHALKGEPEIHPESLREFIRKPHASSHQDDYGIFSLARDLWDLGVSREELEQALYDRAQALLNKKQSAVTTLRNLGKYPPALGMVGTVFGMIRLFDGLSASGSGQQQIGAQLAVAMTATLYGLILSNFIITPLADRIESNEEKRKLNLERTIRAIMSVQDQKPLSVAERVFHAA